MFCEWSDPQVPSIQIGEGSFSQDETGVIISQPTIGLKIYGFSRECSSTAIRAINESLSRIYYCKMGSPRLLPVEKIDYVYFVDPEISTSDELAKRIKFTRRLTGQPAIRLCLDNFSF